jgi:hypothetical protein
MTPNMAANGESSVASLYGNEAVAGTYIQNRFSSSWEKLLHTSQVRQISHVIRAYQSHTILDIAPGPARIAVDLKGVRHGLMIEYSVEMLKLAKHHLSSAGLESLWEIHQHNAFDLESLHLRRKRLVRWSQKGTGPWTGGSRHDRQPPHTGPDGVFPPYVHRQTRLWNRASPWVLSEDGRSCGGGADRMAHGKGSHQKQMPLGKPADKQTAVRLSGMERVRSTEELCAAKVARTVLETRGGSDPLAEFNRALRPAVIARKVSQCSKNARGTHAFAAFTSFVLSPEWGWEVRCGGGNTMPRRQPRPAQERKPPFIVHDAT